MKFMPGDRVRFDSAGQEAGRDGKFATVSPDPHDAAVNDYDPKYLNVIWDDGETDSKWVVKYYSIVEQASAPMDDTRNYLSAITENS